MSNNPNNSNDIQVVLNSTLLEGEIIKWSYLKQQYMLYAITNQRAIIITMSRKATVESFYYEELKIIGTVVHQNGSGDLLFKVTETRDAEAELISIENSGFFDIKDVEDVESILLKELKLIDVSEKKTTGGLYENEKVTWSCSPRPRLFTFETVLKSILGFIICTFLMLFVSGAIYIVISENDKQSITAIFGVVMILAGIGFFALALKFLFSPISLLLKDKKTSYITTNTRALIVKQGKNKKYLTILPDKIHIALTRSNNLILLSEEFYDFDKQYYMDGLGFYRISDANQAVKWISPLLKTGSNRDSALDYKLETSNVKMIRRTYIFVALLSLGFSLFFLFQLILRFASFIVTIKKGISTFEEYLTLALNVVFGCGMYLIGLIIAAYLSYLFFVKE